MCLLCVVVLLLCVLFNEDDKDGGKMIEIIEVNLVCVCDVLFESNF